MFSLNWNENINYYPTTLRERIGHSGRVVDARLWAAGSSLNGITALWSLSKHIYPSLVLVQPRKTRSCLTERLLMGRKESNQTNKQPLNLKWIRPIGKGGKFH